MFVGHYAASFAAKAVDRRVPLWVLFVAGQGPDVLWAGLVLLGIEKVRIVPGITAANPLDLYYFPYSHSLLSAFLLFGLGAAGYRLFRPGEGAWRMGLIVGLALFSHWVLDLLVHRPDLPLVDDTLKVGLGLWNYALPSFLLEAGLLLGGIWLYARATSPAAGGGRYALPVCGLLLLLIQAGITFGAAPPSPAALATMGLGSFAAFAAAAHWLDSRRPWAGVGDETR